MRNLNFDYFKSSLLYTETNLSVLIYGYLLGNIIMFQKSRFKPCKHCQKPVIPADKNCPYCGKPVRNNILPKLIIGVLLLTLVIALVIPRKSKLEKDRNNILNATVAWVDMADWAKISSNTELLNKIGEFEGKIVELQLQVFVATYLSDYFGIVTIPSDGIPGTYLVLYPKNKAEADFIKSIGQGQMIKIRGKVKGTYLKRIKIEPAFLI